MVIYARTLRASLWNRGLEPYKKVPLFTASHRHTGPTLQEVFLQSQHSQFTDDSTHAQDNECGCKHDSVMMWKCVCECVCVCVSAYDNGPGLVRKRSQSVSTSPCYQKCMSGQLPQLFSSSVPVWWGIILIHVSLCFFTVRCSLRWRWVDMTLHFNSQKLLTGFGISTLYPLFSLLLYTCNYLGTGFCRRSVALIVFKIEFSSMK